MEIQGMSPLTEMSVSFLSVGTAVVPTDLAGMSALVGHAVNDQTAFTVRLVRIVQDVVEETALTVKYDMSVTYDLLEMTEDAEDAGFDLVSSVPAGFVREF